MVPRTGCNPRGRNAHLNEIRTGITERRSTKSTEWQHRHAAKSFNRM